MAFAKPKNVSDRPRIRHQEVGDSIFPRTKEAFQGRGPVVGGDVFVMGSGDYGNLGLGQKRDPGIGEWSTCSTPHLVEKVKGLNIKQVCATMRNTIILTGDGNVYSWGTSYFGCLGTGEEQDATIPSPVSVDDTPVAHISCGPFTCSAVTESGDLYTWGSNDKGALGHYDTSRLIIPKPRLVSFFSNLGIRVHMTACATHHTVCLMRHGSVYVMGDNTQGLLGLGERLMGEIVRKPEQITGLDERRIGIVSCGNFHSAALSIQGELYTWGAGELGQLGHNDLRDLSYPRMVRGLSALRPVATVSCGNFCTAAITQEGKLYTWGHNAFGKLGLGSDVKEEILRLPTLLRFLALKKMKMVACGNDHMAAVSEGSELFTWGKGTEGQLGRPSMKTVVKPSVVKHPALKYVAVSCGWSHTITIALPASELYSEESFVQ